MTVCYEKPRWFEYTLANTLFRQFFWYQNVLTAADLPQGSVVVLMEQDELIPVPDVASDCKANGISCAIVPRLNHGFELFWPLSCGRIVQFIRKQTPLGQSDSARGSDVKLFFHNARSSALFSSFIEWSLSILDTISPLRGHSPYNLQMLESVDKFFGGGSLEDTSKSKAN